jgi:hypothetical protein
MGLRQVPGLRMISGGKKKKGPINVPKPTRPPPIEPIAAQRAQRRALQIDPAPAPLSPAQNQDGNFIPATFSNDDPIVPRLRARRRHIMLPESDIEVDEENLHLGREAEPGLQREDEGGLEREEREEEEELACRHSAEEQKRALVKLTGHLNHDPPVPPRKLTLTVRARQLVPANSQV